MGARGGGVPLTAAKQIDRDVAAGLGHGTVSILRAGGYTAPSGGHVDLRAALDGCVVGTVEYRPERQVDLPSTRRNARTIITVENDTVLEIGRRMAADGPVAALNFASATSPGGGFLSGARAQEEAIARSSGLFAALEGRAMYDDPRHSRDAMYSDYVIYSPDVPVFRLDSGELLEQPWPLSIVTCPAVNANGLRKYSPARMGEVEALMTARMAKMLSVAANHGPRRFILGAWGCGAFGLDPEMMARVFDEMLRGPFRGVFSEIVFAITDWSPERRFIGPFKRRFGRSRRSLRIPLTVTRCSPAGQSKRVRYQYGGQRLIPEMLVLRRWRDRSKENTAKANGIRFDGCRLPPGTWTLLNRWIADGLPLSEVTNTNLLKSHAERTRRLGLKLRAPVAEKFSDMLSFLQERKVLRDMMNHERPAETPGIPDLFLYRVDRNGRIHGGRFVEVKRWDRRRKRKERVSAAQEAEIAFLTKLGLAAQVLYVYE